MLSSGVQSCLLVALVAATAHAVRTIRTSGASDDIGVPLVWAYGFVTAATTGLGALPFLLVGRVEKTWLGCSNAAAGGMMLGASAILLMEGYEAEGALAIGWRLGSLVGAGLALGLLFIVVTRVVFAEWFEELQLGNLSAVDSRKALLVLVVMTLHSFSEGVGIGVSFNKQTGATLGPLISISLAMHNVPEGLAIALSLVPRGISARAAILLAVASSLPQPFTAIPAFILVEVRFASMRCAVLVASLCAVWRSAHPLTSPHLPSPFPIRPSRHSPLRCRRRSVLQRAR